MKKTSRYLLTALRRCYFDLRACIRLRLPGKFGPDVMDDARILLMMIPSRSGASSSGDDTEALRSIVGGTFDDRQHTMSASATREGKESKERKARVAGLGYIGMCRNVNAVKND